MAGELGKGVSAILSISENRNKRGLSKGVMIYLIITIFCQVFFLIYDQFSHGVRSPYMTYLFLWPLLLGLVPGLLFWCIPHIRRQGRISANLYHSGVAAVTVSSLLRGIFEIAGTASEYQEWLMMAGGVMLFVGVGAYLLKR